MNFKSDLDSYEEQKIWDEVRDFVNTEDKVYIDDESEWYFGKVIEQEGHIYGKFGRVITDSPVEYDPERGEFIKREGIQAENSLFVINIDRGIIIFNQRMRIGRKQFLQAFSEGFEAYSDIKLDISLLKNQLDLDDVLEEGQIDRANFQLFRGVSDNRNFLIDHIENLNAESVEIIINSREDSEINTNTELFNKALELCTSGYGDYALQVSTLNNQYQVASFDQPATLDLDIGNDLGPLIEKRGELVNFLNDWYHAQPL